MTERVPKKQNFRRHNTSLIGFMALFSTLPTLVAKHLVEHAAWLGKRLTRQRPPASQCLPKGEGGGVGPARPGLTSRLSSRHILTRSHLPLA